MTGTGGTSSRIVVGVDGSAPAEHALRWAMRQAETTGATVEAITAWEIPIGYGVPAALLSDDDLSGAAERLLNEMVERVSADHPRVTVARLVREGHPATVLLDQADQADLLVVGSHGHGGFVGALLGSVSQHCIHHARCPVVVVPAPDRQRGDRRTSNG